MFLLIPYTRLTIKTHLSVQNAEKRLAANVGKRPFFNFFWSTDKLPFTGAVTHDNFNITRTAPYHNFTSLPVITGQFHNNLGSTHIEFSMRPHYFVVIANMLFLIFIAIFLFTIDFLQFITSTCGVGLFLYLLMIIPFNDEARRAQQELEKLFPS